MWCLSALVAALAFGQPEPVSDAPVRPRAIQPGDTIALVAPASPLDRQQILRAVDYLKKRGYSVQVRLEREADGYLSDSDEKRALELNAMLASPEIRAIVCMRGGYGSPRILDRIDYSLARADPKVIVGFSDITA
ncbi:MAG TPA: LD-carboxypeptidase, partial [Planctomycetota bacterium]|nr:LD-carboxypeptidase [Planctomycetota bacterium]